MKTTTGRGQRAMERLLDHAFKPDVRLEEYETPDGIRLRPVGAVSVILCHERLGKVTALTDDDYEALLDLGFCVERASDEETE